MLCLRQTSVNISKTIADILIQLFAFGTTLRRADYIKISKQTDQLCCQQKAQSCKYCVNHISRTALASLKIFSIPS
ncbi:hypothetical protein O3M35_010485 [Rhynocoris fuscipes]|uniref:Uncharacterized protein n=1 Tax=Rhynocoris fuscipes TaxID=488301 RepID=A0AAW1D4G4_9HEMI